MKPALATVLFLLALSASAQIDSTQTWKLLRAKVDTLDLQGDLHGGLVTAILALNQAEKEFGKQHNSYANTLDAVAYFNHMLGHYEKALPIYQQALKIREQVIGKNHYEYAESLYNISGLYRSLGEYEKALPLCQQALPIFKITNGKVVGKRDYGYANCLNQLALLNRDLEQYQPALHYFQQALSIYEEVGDTLHPWYANINNNLAKLYFVMGQYDSALPAFQKALQIREQISGIQSAGYASILDNISSLYESMGQPEKGLSFCQRALTIRQAVLGEEHPDCASSLTNLAKLYWEIGNMDQVPTLLTRSGNIYKKQLLADLTLLSERALRQYQQKYDNGAYAYSAAVVQRSSQLNELNFNYTLHSKGIGLLATQQRRQFLADTKDPIIAKLYADLQSLKYKLNHQYTLPIRQRSYVDSLEKKSDEVEQSLLDRLPRHLQGFEALNVEWPQIQRQLTLKDAAVEFINFPYWNKRWTDSTIYAALVVRPGWKSPQLVILCEQKQIDSLLATRGQERRAAYIERLYTTPGRGATVNSDSKKGQRSLYNLIWQPLDSLLRGVSHVFYSASGLLHRLNLGALPIDSRQRVSDRYQLTQLSSTRQLALNHKLSSKNTSHALLMGGIHYELDSTAYTTANRLYQINRSSAAKLAVRSGSWGESWSDLAQTGPEIDRIADLLRPVGYAVDTLQGWRASEDAFYYYTRPGLSAPRIIHLATHGYFQDIPEKPNLINQVGDQRPVYKLSDNPLIRSGLVLAGGNRVWSGQVALPNHEDGILTAYEISLLDLHQTELVALSACETGLGDIEGSEGVYGLQRAFKMAGARNLIVSLWQVNDNSTQKFMQAFYGAYLRDKRPIRQAFDKAVLQIKNLYSEPYFWAAFVLVE